MTQLASLLMPSAPASLPGGALSASLPAFAFSDIVGSTRLAERLGDRRFAALLGEHNAVVRRALAGRGHEGAFLGDGFLLFFPDARDVVGWAVDAQRGVGRLGLQLRIGAHCGVAVRTEGTWIGRDVIAARRLCEQAGAGEIVVSERLRALAGLPACRIDWA